MTPQNSLQTLAEDFGSQHCSKVRRAILCPRTGSCPEAVKRLDRHPSRLPQLVRRKPRTSLHSGPSRKSTKSCSANAQSHSLHSSLSQKTGIFAMIVSPEKSKWEGAAAQTGGSKDMSGSMWPPPCGFSLSLLLAPHWHHLLPSHCIVRTANINVQRTY